jgi:hypothetical protein
MEYQRKIFRKNFHRAGEQVFGGARGFNPEKVGDDKVKSNL